MKCFFQFLESVATRLWKPSKFPKWVIVDFYGHGQSEFLSLLSLCLFFHFTLFTACYPIGSFSQVFDWPQTHFQYHSCKICQTLHIQTTVVWMLEISISMWIKWISVMLTWENFAFSSSYCSVLSDFLTLLSSFATFLCPITFHKAQMSNAWEHVDYRPACTSKETMHL